MTALPDEALESVNGGWIYINENNQYEVIENRTGAVLAVFDNPDDADNYAISHGVILRLISKTNLEKLRNGEFS